MRCSTIHTEACEQPDDDCRLGQTNQSQPEIHAHGRQRDRCNDCTDCQKAVIQNKKQYNLPIHHSLRLLLRNDLALVSVKEETKGRIRRFMCIIVNEKSARGRHSCVTASPHSLFAFQEVSFASSLMWATSFICPCLTAVSLLPAAPWRRFSLPPLGRTITLSPRPRLPRFQIWPEGRREAGQLSLCWHWLDELSASAHVPYLLIVSFEKAATAPESRVALPPPR